MARRAANRNRPDDAKRPDFKFCVTGWPVSAQAANQLLLQIWKAKVAASASAAVLGRQPFGGDVAEDDVNGLLRLYEQLRVLQ